MALPALRYEINYEMNGQTRKWEVIACSDEEALKKFDECFMEHGDISPNSWIGARWSIQ